MGRCRVTLTAEDRRQIRELIDNYAVLVDAKDYEGVARLFLPEAVLVAPEPPATLTPARSLSGREAIKQELSRLDEFSLTFHGVVGHLVTPGDDGVAVGQVNAVAHHVRLGGRDALDFVWHLRYADQYRSADGAWRFARREISIELIDARPVKRASEARPAPRVSDGA